jgi:hypothetical protein
LNGGQYAENEPLMETAFLLPDPPLSMVMHEARKKLCGVVRLGTS